MGLLCCTFFDNRFLAKKIEKDQRLYYLDYYRGFTHTIVESHTKEKIFFLSLSLIRIFQRPRWPLGQRGSRPFFNYVDKILPIIDHIPKDQIKPNAVWACRRFCLKTNKQICFVYCEKQKNKQKNLFVRFLAESMACQSALGFIWPLPPVDIGEEISLLV